MKLRIMTLLVLASIAAAACSDRNARVEIIPVQDNAAPRNMARGLFPDAPDSLFSALGLQDGIPSSVCAFLVRTEGKNILFDAANGAPDSRLPHVLDSCGVAPEDIDMVFVTHLHGDHIGGLVKDGIAAFPDADVYINDFEYNAWMTMTVEQSAGLRGIVKAYGDRLKKFKVADVLPCGVEAIAAYGHTPGHTVYRIGDILIAGDIMHGVALQSGHPQYCARFDMDKVKSVESRKGILKMAEENGLKVYGMHFPAPYYLTSMPMM